MDLAVQTRGDWDLVLSAARWAEDRGLAAIALPDHYLERGDETERPAYDHLVHLAALARETSKIELVSLLSPVTFRHPAVYYKMGVTLDEISAGRFTMGIGTGWLDEEFTLFGLPYPDRGTRFEMLDECLAYLTAALSPGSKGFDGEHYQLVRVRPSASSPKPEAPGRRWWEQDNADPGRAVCRRVQHLCLHARAIRRQTGPGREDGSRGGA